MSKEKEFKPVRYMRSELVSREDISYLEGKLKTIIDAIVPSDKLLHDSESSIISQNKAVKDIVKMVLWEWFNFILNHTTDHILEKRYWYKQDETDRQLKK